LGQTIKIDTGCIVGYTQGIQFEIERVRGIKNMVFGGEGIFFAKLSGQGKIWLQTLPISRLASRIIAYAPKAGGSSKEEGSILGGLGRLLDGE
jgi:uncharacterized protein (AIM24 family)